MFKAISTIVALQLFLPIHVLTQKTAGYDDLMFYDQSEQLLQELLPAAVYHNNIGDHEILKLDILANDGIASDDLTLYYKLLGLFYLHPEYTEQIISRELFDVKDQQLRNQLALHLGNHYYNRQDYHQAIISYDLISDGEDLESIHASELHFKKGYCLFVTKQFQAARRLFAKGINDRDIYYFPTNYYHAMASYFEGNMDAAIKGFERVRASEKYSPYIPYYLSQIYFANEEYEKLISYAEIELKKPNTNHKDKINKILGQAYFQNGQYDKAKPLLVIDVSTDETRTASETFQIAYVLYKLEKTDEAIPYFRDLSLQNTESALQLNSTILLADSYLRISKAEDAKSALYSAINSSEISIPLRDKLIINYAKLTSQDQQYNDALNALEKIEEESQNYEEARQLMTTIYLKTDDYDRALRYMEGIDNPSTEIKNKTQVLQYNLGTQHYKEKDVAQAIKYYIAAIENDFNPIITIDALFWLGSIYRQELKLKKSTSIYNQYFEKSAKHSTDSEASRKWIAYYNQAYNWLDQKDYANAMKYMDLSVQSYRVEDADSQYTLIYEDALLRSGDLSLQAKNYTKSLERYFKANQIPNAKHSDYSRYQTALIQGFLGTGVQKIVLLESVITDYPTSEYVDNALYFSADAYLNINNEAKAKQAFTRLIKEYPNSPFANKSRLKLGLINYNAGQLDASLSQYEQVLSSDAQAEELVQANEAIKEIYINEKSDAEGYFELVESYSALDQVSDYDKDSLSYFIAKEKYDANEGTAALSQFDMYLSRYINGFYTSEALFYKAELLTKSGKYLEALTSYETLIEKDKNRYQNQSLLKAGAIAYKLNDYEKALKYLKQITNSPDKEIAKIANYSVLESLYQLKKIDEYGPYALRVIQTASASDRQKRFAQYCLASSAYKDGRIIEALDYYRQVASGEKNVRAAESIYQMAEINYKRNDLIQSKQYLGQLTKDYNGYQYWVAKGVLLLSDIYLKDKEYIRAKAAIDSIIQNYKSKDDGIMELATSRRSTLDEILKQQNPIIDAESSDTLIMEYDNNN